MRAVHRVGGGNGCVLRAGVEQKLFDLMAADIAKNAAVLPAFEKPIRAGRRVQPMRAHADGLDYAPDRAFGNQLSGENRVLHMNTLAVVHRILPVCTGGRFARRFQLRKRRQRRLVRKIILAGIHHTQAQARTAHW